MRRSFVGFLLLISPFILSAQQFGGTPPSVKWKQINTDSVRVIFPTGLDSQAQRVASLVHYQAANELVPLGNKLRKINIVLQNQTTIPNGYVGLGPFRSEFYLTPSVNNFDLGSLSWADQLSVHEYRHVQQYNNFHYGISNLMFYLFGQEGYSLAINASVPDWFYEGDAVYNETILTPQGRGRLPLFMNAYPTIWRAHKKYSWMKLRNGSFKDQVPDHYNLGYLLVNYGREKYGLDFWNKVTRDASAFNGLFYPFQHAIKKHTGINYKTFVNDAMKYYKDMPSPLYNANAPVFNEAGPSPVFKLNKKVVTDYLFPYTTEDGSLVYLKKAYNKRPAFFVKDEEGTHWVRVRSIAIDDQYSYRNGKVVYAAFENDARWAWRNYSVIRVLDIKTGDEQKITTKTKYFSPDISASGEKVVAVEISKEGKSELHILDAASGDIKNKIESADVSLFTDPKFISEDSIVCAIRLRDGRMALAVVDIHTGILQQITPASFNVVGYPCVNDNTVYFTASYGGADNVYAVKFSDPQIFKLTDGPQGNYFVNVANGKMTWSSFTAEGYQLQQINTEDIKWQQVDTATINTVVSSYPVSHVNDVEQVLPGFPQRNFPVTKYRKGTKLFNFHSCRPYYADPEFTFTIYGENVLNTLQTEIYYLYNENDRTNAVGANVTFAQLFPYLSVGYQYTFNRQVSVDNKVKQWDQSDARIGFNIPLSSVRGRVVNQFNAGANYFYRRDFNKGYYKDTFTTVQFSYMHYFINWGQQVETARQHIFPRLGYNLSFQYRHAITNYESWQYLAGASLYLPGFFPSHSVVFTAAIQETDTLTVLFGNRFPYSRGYNAAYFAKMWRMSANYHFPLWYTDWGFANIFYLQRIRANAFFDFMKVYDRKGDFFNYQQSTGGEIYFDTKWWNQYPLTFGIRVSYLFDVDYYTNQQGATIFEFILPVSIFPR